MTTVGTGTRGRGRREIRREGGRGEAILPFPTRKMTIPQYIEQGVFLAPKEKRASASPPAKKKIMANGAKGKDTPSASKGDRQEEAATTGGEEGHDDDGGGGRRSSADVRVECESATRTCCAKSSVRLSSYRAIPEFLPPKI
mmetsp:Transcript_7328/g.13370  ORF Transcript_7328/g.13370 Transcript_7328/m.13370 type:complete len:142 (+) Transcript_7328:928-1353(+)